MSSERPPPRRRLPPEQLAVPHEAREIQGDRAGFVTRALANSIDVVVSLLLVGAGYIAVVVVALVLSPTNPRVPSTPFVVFVVATGWVLWLTFALSWATTGRTFGARVMGLRVVNFRGQRLRPLGAALRASFCVLFLPGLFWVAVSGGNRSLQDTVMRTQVIYDWTRRPEPPRSTS